MPVAVGIPLILIGNVVCCSPNASHRGENASASTTSHFPNSPLLFHLSFTMKPSTEWWRTLPAPAASSPLCSNCGMEGHTASTAVFGVIVGLIADYRGDGGAIFKPAILSPWPVAQTAAGFGKTAAKSSLAVSGQHFSPPAYELGWACDVSY